MSSYEKTGGPAFPFVKADFEFESGMTVRDYFAAAYLANKWSTSNNHEATAKNAYAVADAMLKARKA